jgi:DNA-binding beta-propeller fold protein YncE
MTADVAANNSKALAGSAGGQMGFADGGGSAALFGGTGGGLAASLDGNFALVVDSGNRVLRKLILATGEVTTLAGIAGTAGAADGKGTAARCYLPAGVGVSPDGNFALVADAGWPALL